MEASSKGVASAAPFALGSARVGFGPVLVADECIQGIKFQRITTLSRLSLIPIPSALPEPSEHPMHYGEHQCAEKRGEEAADAEAADQLAREVQNDCVYHQIDQSERKPVEWPGDEPKQQAKRYIQQANNQRGDQCSGEVCHFKTGHHVGDDQESKSIEKPSHQESNHS